MGNHGISPGRTEHKASWFRVVDGYRGQVVELFDNHFVKRLKVCEHLHLTRDEAEACGKQLLTEMEL